ncbi:acyl carrier protein, chloroplastic [Physcomitrium patens]|uniref:Acyl carrier protein n=2 Tax=Physcomitrium patens TaxID=3218 RepID=A0A2K1J5B9_PHYPA|nr:hypothetical protein PHYPA_022568 [Physcomitrium patens]PNR36721.1 hypothetical protein PHYPA_022572 [Physcomitrium patens]
MCFKRFGIAQCLFPHFCSSPFLTPPLAASLHPLPAMASLTVVAAAAITAALASPRSVPFSGLRSLRTLSSVVACPRLVLVSRHARVLPCIRASASEEDAFSIIQDIIAEQLACDKNSITPDSKFTDLGADSLDTVEIMMALEERFDIQVEQDNADKIVTVGNAADLIKEVIASK